MIPKITTTIYVESVSAFLCTQCGLMIHNHLIHDALSKELRSDHKDFIVQVSHDIPNIVKHLDLSCFDCGNDKVRRIEVPSDYFKENEYVKRLTKEEMVEVLV